MNEQLFASQIQAYCETLLAIRKSGEWKGQAATFDAYVVARWSLSKTRAKQLCNFAQFRLMCRDAGMQLPDTPENVAPVLDLAQKRWLTAWEYVTTTADGVINKQHCKATLERFGLFSKSREPAHIRESRQAREAAKKLAGIQDPEELASHMRSGGEYWQDGVHNMIEIDQALMNKR